MKILLLVLVALMLIVGLSPTVSAHREPKEGPKEGPKSGTEIRACEQPPCN